MAKNQKEIDSEKIRNEEKNYDQLCKDLFDGNARISLFVPLLKVEEFFNKLIGKFEKTKTTITISAPLLNFIEVPKDLKIDENSYSDLTDESLLFSPIHLSSSPQKASIEIKKNLNDERLSEADFTIEIETSLGIIILVKERENDHVSLLRMAKDSFTDRNSARLPLKLFSEAMSVMLPYVTSRKLPKL